MAELKPCPCCGGKAEPWQHFNGGWKVWCPKCKLQTGLFRLVEYAIEAWNRRVNDGKA